MYIEDVSFTEVGYYIYLNGLEDDRCDVWDDHVLKKKKKGELNANLMLSSVKVEK